MNLIPLGQALTAILGGGTPPKDIPENFSGDIPFMTVKDMTVARPKDTIDHITQNALKNSSARLVPADTVIIATRMGLGKVVRPTVDVAINQDLKALFPSPELDKNYLEKWLLKMAPFIQISGQGTTVKGVRISFLEELQIPLPSLPEQAQIVSRIEHLFSQLEEGEAALKHAEAQLVRYKQAILKSATNGNLLYGVPSEETLLPGWTKGKIGDLADFKNGYAFRSSDFQEEGAPLLKQSNLTGLHVDMSKCDYLPPAYLKSYEDYLIHKGDIILGLSGSIGEPSVYMENYPALQNQRTALIKPKNNSEVSKRFIMYTLSFFEKTNFMKGKGAGVLNISCRDIQNIPLNIPPEPEQARIVEKLDMAMVIFDDMKKTLKQTRSFYATLRQSILHAAFNGQLIKEPTA